MAYSRALTESWQEGAQWKHLFLIYQGSILSTSLGLRRVTSYVHSTKLLIDSFFMLLSSFERSFELHTKSLPFVDLACIEYDSGINLLDMCGCCTEPSWCPRHAWSLPSKTHHPPTRAYVARAWARVSKWTRQWNALAGARRVVDQLHTTNHADVVGETTCNGSTAATTKRPLFPIL